MKQIILISRINEYGDYNEFEKYSNDLSKAYLIAFENDAFRLVIINGFLLYDLNSSNEMVESIFNMGIITGFSAESTSVLAYHYDGNLDKSIKNIFQERHKWNFLYIVQYSGGERNPNTPLYDLLHSIGNALKGNIPVASNLVADLWTFFTGDPILESNLNLLHSILLGNKNNLWNEVDTIYKNALEAFQEVCTPHYDNNNSIHRNALKIFRDILLANYQS